MPFDVFDLLGEISNTLTQGVQVLICQSFIKRFSCNDLEPATVGLERPDGSDDNGSVRAQSTHPAFDVEELFGAEVSAKTGFGNKDVGEFQSDLVGNNR